MDQEGGFSSRMGNPHPYYSNLMVVLSLVANAEYGGSLFGASSSLTLLNNGSMVVRMGNGGAWDNLGDGTEMTSRDLSPVTLPLPPST